MAVRLVERRVAKLLIRQFDVCRLRKAKANDPATLVVVLQHDELADVATINVAPLIVGLPEEKRPRLHPWNDLPDGRAMLAVERMAGVDRRELAEPIGTAVKHANEIKHALDIAFYGF